MFKVSFTRRKIALAGAAILAVTAAASSAPAARGPALRAFSPAIGHGFKPDAAPAGSNCTTGTSAPYYCLGAENDSTQNGFSYGVYGLEGYAPKSSGGVGVLGYSGNSAVSGAYGVYGVTFSTNGIGVYGAGDGPTPGPADTPSSIVNSTGVVGDSHAGDGVYGSTEWSGSPYLSGQIGGVVGVDNRTSSSYNDGVIGITDNGGYGVYGLVTEASGDDALGAVGGVGIHQSGVVGSSKYEAGVVGVGESGPGLLGYTENGAETILGSSDTTAAGVSGVSSGNGGGLSGGANGVVGTSTYSNGSSSSDVCGNGACTGVAGISTEGDGLYGSSTNYIGAYIQNDSSTYSTLFVNSEKTGNNPLFVENSTAGLLKLDSSGNLTIRGTLTQSATSFSRTRNPNSDLMSYGAQVAEPTMEDVGSAELVNGSAAVALGSDFRQMIDGSARYMVFLTPYGENNGLYVASRTPNGFVVRESHGGRSTMSFDYRIVAKQFGASEGRLPRASSMRAGGITSADIARAGGLPSAGALAKLAAAAVQPKLGAKAAAFERSVQNGTAFRYQRFTPRANKLVENRLR